MAGSIYQVIFLYILVSISSQEIEEMRIVETFGIINRKIALPYFVLFFADRANPDFVQSKRGSGRSKEVLCDSALVGR
jgi:hypothetical protein